MDINNLSKKVRLMLYKHSDCETIRCELHQVLESYEYKGDVSILEDQKSIIVDIPPFFRYKKNKKPPIKLYEIREV